MKLEEKEKQSEKGDKLLKESKEDLKARLAIKENELQEKGEVVEILAIIPTIETDTTSLSNAMSQVNLRDVELTGLKQQNKNLEDVASKKKEEKRKLIERCQEFLEQIAKLSKQVISQMAI